MTTHNRLAIVVLLLVGVLGFAPTGQALTDAQIKDLSIFARNFRSVNPNLFAEVAQDEGYTIPQFAARMNEFSHAILVDGSLQSVGSLGQAIRKFFLDYHSETVNPPGNIDTLVHEIVKHVLQSSYNAQRLGLRQTLARGHSMRMMRNMGKVMQLKSQGRGPQHAGEIKPEDFFANASFSLSGSYAWIEDDIAQGQGSDSDLSIWGAAGYGDLWTYGLGLTVNRFEIDSSPEIDQTNWMVDAYVSRLIGAGISVGAFFDYTHSVTEDKTVTLGSSTLDFGGTTNTIGAGILVNGTYSLQWFDVSATTTLASMNKSAPSDLFKSADSLWLTQVELSRQFTGTFSGSLYGTAIHLLDENDSGYDRDYGNIGVDLRARLTEKVEVNLGLQKGIFQTAYEDHRLSAGVTVWW